MERIKEWDFIKGILIFCVLYGHINAYITPSSIGDAFNISPTLVIRLFQMPLFILVSGNFAKSVDSFGSYIKVFEKYFTRLVIPYIIWCLILALTKNHDDSSTLILDFRESIGLLWFIPMLLMSHFVFTTYSLILSQLGLFSGKSVLLLLVMHIIFSMLLPNDICNYFFLFPFYIAGFFLKNVDIHSLLNRLRGWVFIMLLLSFIICIVFPNSWTFYQSSNYAAGFDVHIILFVMFRYICYSIVTLTALLLLFKTYKTIEGKSPNRLKSICRVGKEQTLFLYLAHISMLYYTLRIYVLNNEKDLMGVIGNPIIRSYAVAIVLTMLIVILLTLLYKLLYRNVVTRKFLIGV